MDSRYATLVGEYDRFADEMRRYFHRKNSTKEIWKKTFNAAVTLWDVKKPKPKYTVKSPLVVVDCGKGYRKSLALCYLGLAIHMVQDWYAHRMEVTQNGKKHSSGDFHKINGKRGWADNPDVFSYRLEWTEKNSMTMLNKFIKGEKIPKKGIILTKGKTTDTDRNARNVKLRKQHWIIN